METAAIFEHEILWAISREVCARRGYDWQPTTIKAFQAMHLDGVEQSHKDELGVFVDPSGAEPSDGGGGGSTGPSSSPAPSRRSTP